MFQGKTSSDSWLKIGKMDDSIAGFSAFVWALVSSFLRTAEDGESANLGFDANSGNPANVNRNRVQGCLGWICLFADVSCTAPELTFIHLPPSPKCDALPNSPRSSACIRFAFNLANPIRPESYPRRDSLKEAPSSAGGNPSRETRLEQDGIAFDSETRTAKTSKHPESK
jgi:hypothetical protein